MAVLATAAILPSACTSSAPRPVAIPFVAEIAGEPFACDRTFTVNGDGATFQPRDLRLYVMDVHLLDGDGVATPVTLADDGIFQNGAVALLDFEDGTGGCQNGTERTHTTLAGTAPPGDYRALRFALGVPFEANHANPATAEPPLSMGRMHWSWQAGYKFIRFEGVADEGESYRLHLGSTGCEGTIGDVTGCTRPNRPSIVLEGFRPGERTVVLELAPLVGGAVDCLAEVDEPGCAEAFAALGLELASGVPGPAQRLFTVR